MAEKLTSWSKKVTEYENYEQTAGHTFAFRQTEVKDNPAMLTAFGQHVETTALTWRRLYSVF